MPPTRPSKAPPRAHRSTLLAAVLIGCALSLSAPTRADDKESPSTSETSPEDLAVEGLDNLMQALELLLMRIPQYELPEVNERGDIIIRRKNPPQDAPESPEPESPAPDAPETDTSGPDATET